MISVAEAISDLLFVRDTVVVPGLGAFVKKPISAKANIVANHFAMPSSTLGFDANLREDNDLIIDYLSERNNMSADKARRMLVMFVSDCFNSMKEGKKVTLQGIGTLSFDGAGNIGFEPTDALNYNADAFGLCDISPEPVLRFKTKDEIKEEIAQQQKDKNTPVTVDEKAVHEKDREENDDKNEPQRHHGWLWTVLGLLLLVAVGFGLYHFKVVDFGQWLKQADEQPWKVVVPEAVWKWDADTIVKPKEEFVPEANIFIIAGCYDREENASRFANTLRENGFSNAFYLLRNKKWYVAFGRYCTEEEAAEAIDEIRMNTEYKAWILTP